MERERKSGCTVGIVAMLALLPLLYAPSVGPAAWLAQRRLLPEPVAYVYRPLEWAAEMSPNFESVLVWYVTLWAPDSAPAPMPTIAPTPAATAPTPAPPSPQSTSAP